MREIARVQRRELYNANVYNNSKSSYAKLPVVLCTIAGILLGSFIFKFTNGGLSFSEDFFMDTLFKAFGMDRYNPITIVNSNYPYLKMFYDNKYLEYVAQQEIAQKAAETDKLEKTQGKEASENQNNVITPDNLQEDLKVASSSITYEGDENEQNEKSSNPVVSDGKINIVNNTKYSIDINKMLKEPLKLPTVKGPQIFIYHTHTTESFLKSLDELTMKNVASRTTNNKYNVVKVGDQLTKDLKKYDISVLHNTTIHDKDYNSSYVQSLRTLTNYVEKYPSFKMTIDLHRDAISEGKLRMVKKIDGKDVAQIMFVIGTDSKLSNPNWRENLKLAIKLQARLNEICPGLARPIHISQSRYNQQLTSGSVLVEIGGDGNVIDECVRSTKYLAQAINDVIYKNK